MESELFETLKLLTISPKCISQSLEQMIANPNEERETVTTNRCNHCFVCNDLIHGKTFKKKEMKVLLWRVFLKKENIEGKLTTDKVIHAI